MLTYEMMRNLMDAIHEDGIDPRPTGARTRAQEVIRLFQGPDGYYSRPLEPEYVVRRATPEMMELAAIVRRVKGAMA